MHIIENNPQPKKEASRDHYQKNPNPQKRKSKERQAFINKTLLKNDITRIEMQYYVQLKTNF